MQKITLLHNQHFTVIILHLVAFLLCSSLQNVTASGTGPSHDKVVVCYIGTWATYRPGFGSFTLDHVDPSLCTHLIYAFSGLDTDTDGIKALDPWQDLKDNYGKGGFERLTGMKKINPHLKVTLAIGGWNEGSVKYSQMSANPARRAKFVKNAVEFVKRFNFDGLDLDWEYPTQRDGKPEDKENFVNLVVELKREFRKHDLILTSAIGASKIMIDEAYDVKTLSNHLDFMHIMCYDYSGSWDKKVGPNAPLDNNGILDIESTIAHLLSRGASPSKLVLGLPFYGRTFLAHGEGYFGDPTDDKGFPGPYTKESGFMGYNEICAAVQNTSAAWTVTWDKATDQAVARKQNTETGETRVVTFDSGRSIANKIRYAVKLNLAGAMVWSIDTDDFLGKCERDNDTFVDYVAREGVKLSFPRRVNDNFPLLRTINEAIIVAQSELEQEAAIAEQEKDNEIPHGAAASATVCFQTHFLAALVILSIFSCGYFRC
ncbi:probable chitinase 2 [Phlebotomus argentipes]|uniref:probable chitinase 2 n=1 Tax=Phlebotomus argentipes TaxID=94469 RepID=UPI002892EFA1|nr:probable chitinase 2 [Phlebotomus argentipes]